jgi:serine/threonine-protein kinase
MSPEQAAGRNLDPRSDLYSVGIMLFELIAGHPPFVDNDAVVVMARHIRDKAESLSRAAPLRNIPPSLDAVVARSLAKQPDERFQTAEEFERALEACAHDVTHATGSRSRQLLHDKKRLAIGAALVLGLGVTGLWLRSRGDTLDDAKALTASTPVNAAPDHASTVTATGAAEGMGLASASTSPDTAGAEANRQVEAPRSVVSLRTAPTAAAVLQDGSELGLTPLDVSLSRGSTLTLLLRKKGFAEETLELHADDGARVVTLRRLRDHDRHRDRTKSSSGSRRTKERPARTGANQPTSEPQAPSTEKSSPYERF